jgi:hypothetical protein
MTSKQGEAKMRVFRISLIVIASLAQAHAEEPTNAKSNTNNTKSNTNNNCHYTVSGGRSVEIAVGKSACVRAPPPYTDIYGLLVCYPPLTEIDEVKRGDPRCGDRYEN